ncbi:YdhK family protein [Solibacillus isronensis]|uniref:YdhK family protein n=2 Tax=Caryophanaceae TaxID=186818 RepID=UPI000B233863|nr:YdhK family protein [Solibacillus silvestris]
MANKLMIGIFSITAILTLTACTGNDNDKSSQDEVQSNEMTGHNMNQPGTGEVPEGLKKAENPKYPVGNTAIIQADHMGGMKGAEATIIAAYDTTVYTVSYIPTNGGEPVINHKWIIQEELEGIGEEPLEIGTEVKINADHMEGMKGSTATIDSVKETTVYMVDYISTTGEKVTNHKWLTESELVVK